MAQAVPRMPDDERHAAEESVELPTSGAVMTIVGVQLSPSTVAKLALELHRAGEFALAVQLGRAVDEARFDIALERDDHEAILRVIAAVAADESPRFRELRGVLSDHATTGRSAQAD